LNAPKCTNKYHSEIREKAGFAKLVDAGVTMGANLTLARCKVKKKLAAAVVLSAWNSGFGFT
jgi:hypothetical protein